MRERDLLQCCRLAAKDSCRNDRKLKVELELENIGLEKLENLGYLLKQLDQISRILQLSLKFLI